MGKIFQNSAGWFFTLLLWGVFPALTHAANVEPEQAKNQYLYGENIGWVNAYPNGSGLQADANNLTGYLWSENVGWINLSCKNKNTCGAVNYGVKNDEKGVLSGYAWGENIGWINFKPTGGGVTLDPNTGVFDGKAWGENIGWLSLRSTAPGGFQVSSPSRSDVGPAVQAEGGQVNKESGTESGKTAGSSNGGGFWSCQLFHGPGKFNSPDWILFGSLVLLFLPFRRNSRGPPLR